MIHFESVSKNYRLRGGARRQVLSNLTLTLPHRNIGVLGRNGAGKSTLLQLIAGILDPDWGRVRRDVRVSWPIGFRGSFHGQLTGLENIRFVARVYGVEEKAVIDSVAAFAEIGPFMNEPVHTYSSGMGARLAFGLSMALKFDTYLVDELLSVGDARFQKKSKAAFNDLLSRSRMIMVSHSVAALREYCDCGLLVSNGTAVLFDRLDDAIEAYNAQNA
ncbi:ABC transporter ATP-binding protein [Phaeovulum sp.]|uniref:ABC transporter ATP-binding protein n=1 Tax=Phaeovulum sp. TaxID=2934796 RepID=UPI00273049E7|nr:ABC transporter ATP-binding protein [Phaeovulum sp.]MDP1667532.1 ABC transporter ATP-binding protein [Phaeovulum sp.]MDP3860633.1 ABC transporter ATP-binding protein [Phaeovulum sp.]MDZ4120049.1 ABC transporter ATP-binding protein [Phaeovulum sp.]